MVSPRILVVRLSAVGDVIRTLPAVKAVKEHYPSSHVAWVVEEPSKTLLESQPEIDEVILFPRRRWTQGLRSPRQRVQTAKEIWQFIKNLRRQRFDLVLDFHGIMKSGIIAFFSGSPQRIGFDWRSSREGNFLFSNIKVRLPRESMNRYRRNAFLLKGIGLDINPLRADLSLPAEDRDYVDAFLRGLSTPVARPLIAIHPGSSLTFASKRWMADRYAQLADRLIREFRGTVLFTWGPEELTRVESIRQAMNETSLLGPRTASLTQLGEVFRRCDLFIGGDTGPMQVASMVGTPVIVIYGPTDPILYEPLGVHRNLFKEVGCNPCRKRSCRDLRCLKAIDVGDVFDTAREVLGIT